MDCVASSFLLSLEALTTIVRIWPGQGSPAYTASVMAVLAVLAIPKDIGQLRSAFTINQASSQQEWLR